MTQKDDGIPSHWFGTATAPNFGRRCARAQAALHEADEALLRALKADYPLDAPVTVVHYRGQFSGRVAGWDRFGCRVVVRNDASGKVAKWWAAHVQLREGSSADGSPT